MNKMKLMSLCGLLAASMVTGCLDLGLSSGVSSENQEISQEKQPLPAWQTEAEKRLNRAASRAVSPTSPPAGNVYVPAEYADMEGVLLHIPPFEGWSEPTLWADYYHDLVQGLVDSGTMVYILVPDQARATHLKNNVLPNSISESQVTFLEINNITTWTRDFGPWLVYENNQRVTIDLYYYGTREDDDLVPVRLAQAWNEPRYTAALYTEGGNFMTDGLGTCWASTGVLNRNNLSQSKIEEIYKDYVGCDTITFVEPIPGEGTTHIDMFSKVLNQDTILVGTSSISLGAEQREISHLNQVAEVYRNSPKPGGGEWNIVRIPMTFGYYNFGTEQAPNWRRVYYTHTNSLVVNNSVLVPTYGRGNDAQALQIYRDAMPGYDVVGIESTKPIRIGGAIHCTTMQIPHSAYQSCGDGVITAGEECEPRYLGGESCQSLGYTPGELGCTSNCTFDLSNCGVQDKCGNDQLDPGEVCDGDQVECADLDPNQYQAGWATCQAGCGGYDVSHCIDKDTGGENDCIDAPCTNNQSQPIPDNNSTGIRSEINVGDFTGSLDQVRVNVEITHTYIGDLIVGLISPEGTTVYLHNRTGKSADNLSLDKVLDDFAGENPVGSWKLAVIDKAGQDVGSLQNWSIQLTADDNTSRPVEIKKQGNVARGEWYHYGPFQVNDGFQAELLMDADADLYVKRENQPSANSYDCRPYESGSKTETCNLSGAGTYYVSVNGYDANTNFALTIQYKQ